MFTDKDSYQGNSNLKRAGVQINFTQEMLEEYVKCKNDPLYFVENYMKIVHVDEGLVNFEMFDYQKEMLEHIDDNRYSILLTARQIGKALDIETPILTPNGFKKLKELNVGDYIFDRKGNETKISYITDTMYERDCYEIEFDNGEVITADGEHIWKISQTGNWKDREYDLTTNELIEHFNHFENLRKAGNKTGRLYVNITEPIEFEEQDISIDPYVLGLWLGDGDSSGGRITMSKDDFNEYKEIIGNNFFYLNDYSEDKRNLNTVSSKVENLCYSLNEESIKNNKHIPDNYIFNTIENRLELIRGLMDSDGYCSKNGRCEFYQKDESFIDSVRFILSSLGIKTRKRNKIVNGEVYYMLWFTSPKFNVFKLPRKLERQKELKNHKQNERLYITDIRKTNSVPVRCLQVDSDEHMFNCGKTLIPTHNTSVTVAFLLHYVLFNDHKRIGILANREKTAIEILSRIQLAYEHLPKWLQQGVEEWNKGSIFLENGSSILASSTSSTTVRGYSFSVLFVDECAFIRSSIWEEFWNSVYPTISSGRDTKVILVSCVTEDTMVLDENGISEVSEYIDHQKNGGYEIPNYKVHGKDGFKTGSIMYNNGLAETLNIYSSYSNVKCSKEHKLWAIKQNRESGWYKAKELEEGDYICHSYGNNIWGNDTSINLNTEYSNKNKNNYQFPELTEDLCYFLGLYISEGYARKIENRRGGQITITCGDDISPVLDNLEINYQCYDDLHYTINSLYMVDLLESIGFDINKKANEKEIPKKLLKLPKPQMKALMQGIFDGDGTTNKNNGSVSINLSSKKLIEQIRFILMNFGVLTSYSEGVTPPTEKVSVYSTYYRLTTYKEYAQKFFSEIGFRFQRKQLPHKLENYLNENVSENLVWSPIKSIEDNGEEYVYDFSLNHDDNDQWCHSVLYNGIVGHQTPNGLNHFYKLYHDAKNGKNSFNQITIPWYRVPGRDEQWKKETIANTSEEQFAQEHDCDFQGSSNTLIHSRKIKELAAKDPIHTSTDGKYKVYQEPKEGHVYIGICDVSHGKGLDYSVMNIIDITDYPFEQVAIFRDNTISPLLYPDKIATIGEYYNNAYVMVENNENGSQVLTILNHELEYENIISPGAGEGEKKRYEMGVRTTKKVKRIGCSNFRDLVENDKLVVHDDDTIFEISGFVAKGQSYEADSGFNDDTVMTLVIFSWFTTNPFFKDLTDQDVREQIKQNQELEDEEDLTPFGFIDDGVDETGPGNIVHEDGMVWETSEWFDT